MNHVILMVLHLQQMQDGAHIKINNHLKKTYKVLYRSFLFYILDIYEAYGVFDVFLISHITQAIKNKIAGINPESKVSRGMITAETIAKILAALGFLLPTK